MKTATIESSVVWGRETVLASLRDASGLLDRHPVSARSVWLSCWIEAFRDREPVGVILRRDGIVVGFACLAFRRRGLLREAALAGDGVSDYARLTAADEAAQRQLAEQVASIVRSTRGPWRLRFDQLPAEDPLTGLLARSVPYGELEPTDPLPMLRIGEPRTLEAHTHRHLRQAFRKANRKIAGHRLETETLTDPAAIRALWPKLEELARRRDHSIGRRSPFDDGQWRAFYRLAMSRLAADGQVALTTLRLDGQLVIYMVVLRDRGVWRLWDSRMNPEYAWSSPGYLMYGHFIQQALSNPAVQEIDWQRGMSPHKVQSSSGVRKGVRLVAYSGRFVRAWCRAEENARQHAREALPATVKRALHGDLRPLLAAARDRLRSVSSVVHGRSANAGQDAASGHGR
ncbi:GNAT family N-acetyltransferase [Streptomyces afghaniensis]|uniref:GNAT family N-acetyltransferase n=1 Tax=Streptomyces afghaniensis TaxID=66865 RepID=UPI002780DBA0|nr:GNAT family N-acetyltransferase [Streptomyces afghaniensis]MDQ1014671.1 CelD/BcsL family acetyltransferase involved in cellulose biosynthesis [Streptomyces afghaniensis]